MIAQDPKTAGVEGMPRSAIATGIVDLVLPPEKIPEALLNLARHPYVRQPAETAVEQALQAYRVKHPQAVEVQGEPVQLAPSQGLELSLILHELETNAAKYGALSHHEGVRLSWRVDNDGQGRRLRLRWDEEGGPQVEPPIEGLRHAADRAGVQP